VTAASSGAAPSTRYREVEREVGSRRPEQSIEPTLGRIAGLAELLGDPQRAYPVIHITGTNGKTSCARMVDTLLRARGLRTGRFTSPHLESMRERICVDGEPLSEERFVEAYEDVLPQVRMVDERDVPLSFFEVLTGMAYAAFADAPVDVAVVEVGIGGVWDATNIADGSVAVVTPISVDHTRYLGDTITAIATEKAGIIKRGAVAVLGQQPVDAAEVLLRRCAQEGASVAREGIEFGVLQREIAVGGQRLALRGLHGVYENLFLPLFGAHQASNAACALAAVEAFAGIGAAGSVGAGVGPVELGSGSLGSNGHGTGDALDPELVGEAFREMTSPGRLEVVRRSPTVLIDAAHNPAGMTATVAALEESFTFSTLIGVVAVMADKDVAGLLEPLEPLLSEVVVTRNSEIRSMDPGELADEAAAIFGPERVHTEARIDDAIETAVRLADEAAPGDVPGGTAVLVTGSVVTAGDARLLLARDHGRP
jgi:dihydrofolate synthase / folylpolyglutamate synthase